MYIQEYMFINKAIVLRAKNSTEDMSFGACLNMGWFECILYLLME